MLIDCVSIAARLDERIARFASEMRARGEAPQLCEIVATSANSAISYSKTKERKAEKLGIEFRVVRFGQSDPMEAVLQEVSRLCANPAIHGVLVGMPTFPHIDAERLLAVIPPYKDVDGLGPLNSHLVYSNQEHNAIAPATAIAAIHVLETRTTLKGKRVAVIGRGRTVGRPVATMLSNRDATVTLCHSRTPVDVLRDVVAASDVVVSATGMPGVLQTDWFRPAQIVVDCGIAFADGKTRGDVDSLALDAAGVEVTPVPQGVGLVTNSMIFGNLARAIGLGTVNV